MTTMAKKKSVKLDHHHFGESPDDPSFNIDAARSAHADVMRRWDDPKEGDDFKALILHTIQNATATDIETHRADIQRFLDEFGASQKNALSKAIVKSYVAKRRSREPRRSARTVSGIPACTRAARTASSGSAATVRPGWSPRGHRTDRARAHGQHGSCSSRPRASPERPGTRART